MEYMTSTALIIKLSYTIQQPKIILFLTLFFVFDIIEILTIRSPSYLSE